MDSLLYLTFFYLALIDWGSTYVPIANNANRITNTHLFPACIVNCDVIDFKTYQLGHNDHTNT